MPCSDGEQGILVCNVENSFVVAWEVVFLRTKLLPEERCTCIKGGFALKSS